MNADFWKINKRRIKGKAAGCILHSYTGKYNIFANLRICQMYFERNSGICWSANGLVDFLLSITIGQGWQLFNLGLKGFWYLSIPSTACALVVSKMWSNPVYSYLLTIISGLGTFTNLKSFAYVTKTFDTTNNLFNILAKDSVSLQCSLEAWQPWSVKDPKTTRRRLAILKEQVKLSNHRLLEA